MSRDEPDPLPPKSSLEQVLTAIAWLFIIGVGAVVVFYIVVFGMWAASI